MKLPGLYRATNKCKKLIALLIAVSGLVQHWVRSWPLFSGHLFIKSLLVGSVQCRPMQYVAASLLQTENQTESLPA